MDTESFKEQFTPWERDFFSKDIQLLYKYRQDIYRDLLTIANNQLFIPTKDDLNDPNESCISLKDVYRELEHIKQFASKHSDSSLEETATSSIRVINKLTDNIGILSLSKKYDIECMWSYYANGHKGFCIEYDAKSLRDCFKGQKLFMHNLEVKYSNKRAVLNVENISSFIENNPIDFLRGIFASKSNSWAQEEEVRYTLQKIKKSQYIDIPYKSITGIYIGAKCSEFDKNIILKTIRSIGNNDIRLYQMKFKDDSFNMEREDITYQLKI